MRPGLLSALANARVQRVGVLLFVFALPLLFVAKDALVDPDIEFLPPAFGAKWALHPVQRILNFQNGRVALDVELSREFVHAPPAAAPVLKLVAFTMPRVFVNDVELSPTLAHSNWKHPRVYDLAPAILNGTNRLRVIVSNAGAIPALLVTAPPALRTPAGWVAALETDGTLTVPVVTADVTSREPGPLQTWAGWRWARWLAAAWLIGVGCIGVVALVRPRRREPPHTRQRWTASPFARIVPLSIFAVSAGLNVWNTARYAPGPELGRSFDWNGHVAYIQHVARHWTTPLALDGWQMYQPPLYYYLAAMVYRVTGGDATPELSLRATQYFGCLSGIGLSVIAWLFARRFRPDDVPAQWIALGCATFLPMTLYMNPLITNEVFSSTVIAGSLYLFWRASERQSLSWKSAASLGLVAGLALLSKFTGLFTLAAGCALLGLRAVTRRSKRDWGVLAVCLGVALIVSGWFYVRNALVFGDPFIGNWDVASGFHYEQKPSYRTLHFYLQFGQAFFQHPQETPWLSWADGNYASMWADTHGRVFRAEDTREYFLMGLMLLLAALPTTVMVVGGWRTLMSVWARPAWNGDLLLLAVPVWTWGALIRFTLEIPTYSTVKAWFFLSLVPVLGVYLIRGREALPLWARGILDGTIAILGLLAVVVYRFPKG